MQLLTRIALERDHHGIKMDGINRSSKKRRWKEWKMMHLIEII